jgi:hypothetical protein
VITALAGLAVLAAPFASASRGPRRAAPLRTVVLTTEVATASPPTHPDAAKRSAPTTPSPPSLTHESLVPLRLQSAAFPELRAPGALVYVPAGIDRARPLDVVVFFHGWNGCAAAVASPVAIPCRAQGPRRGALDLVGQMRASGRAAVLVIPQLAMERPSGDAGRFRRPEHFRIFLQEVLDGVAPQVGARSVDALGRVIIAAHSGGYEAALLVLKHGGVTVDQLSFFDAFYGGTYQVAGWLQQSLEDPSLGRRFVSVYGGSGAGAGSRAMLRLLQPALAASGREGVVRARTVPGRVTLEEASATIAAVHSTGDHQQTVRWNFATVLRGADLAPVAR